MIRRAALAVAFAAACGVAGASVASAADSGDKRSTCAQWEKLARVMMEGRQVGVPMSKAMESASNPLIEKIVVAAYEQPRF